MAGSCDFVNEYLEYAIDEKFIDQLYDYQVFKKAFHHGNQYDDQVYKS